MPKPKKGPRLGGSPAHHDALVANLATELFRHGRIRTTRAKAKAAQPVAERMITFAKRGDIHARRQVLKVIRDKDVVHKLFADIGPAVAERNGGYTRLVKLGPRPGDAAEMVAFELVDAVDGRGEVDLTEEPRRRWSLRRRFGSLSRSAREREETAAEPAVREPAAGPAEEEEDAVAAGRITERALKSDDVAPERTGPDVSPEEVEARLGAEDEDEDVDEDVAAEDEDPNADEPTGDEE